MTEDKVPVICSQECGYEGWRNQSTAFSRACPRCGQKVRLKTKTYGAEDRLPPSLPGCQYRMRPGCSGWWVSYFQASNRRQSQASLGDMRNDELTLETWARERAKGARLMVIGEYLMPRLRKILSGEAGDVAAALNHAVAAEQKES